MEILENEQQLHVLQEKEEGQSASSLRSPVATIEHYHRYLFATRFTADRRVLDVGCGDGYGTAFLSMHAREVLGIDRDDDAIIRAREKYHQFENVRFDACRYEDLNLASGPIDVALCFQVLEKLDGESRDRLLGGLKHLLVPGGMAIIATPDRSSLPVGYDQSVAATQL